MAGKRVMDPTSQPVNDDPPGLRLSDTFDEQHTSFGLFKAYKEGQLDLNILSTQDAISAASTTAEVGSGTSSSSAIRTSNDNSQQSEISKQHSLPKSWCMSSETSQSGSPNKKLTLGLFFKPKPTGDIISSTSESQTPSVVRVPAATVASIEENKSGQAGTLLSRGNAILVNQRQRGNAVLKQIRNVAWEYADVEPDFVVGRNNCVYFLSLRYHNLNSEYIFERLRQTKQRYQLSVLLVQVDVPDPYYPLKELCKICWTERLTLMLAWSVEEAARYLEAYKALENKPPDSLMAESNNQSDYAVQFTDFLTSVRRITKADAVSAMTKFDVGLLTFFLKVPFLSYACLSNRC
uniref:ERCC1-like central domain-containing protein n=1 Tax=Trichobilharzia regenti TaxID=157069 RepID=A0AA85JXZ0_TRIRE|nr:unnamed protein product [Trichobilharzia regenti]